VIDLSGTTGGATIQADGTGPLVLTSANTASGAGKKTLTLQGSNTGANTIAARIVDSSTPSTSVVKAQAGTWALNGTNTYTGGTTISGGTLEIGATGKIAGNVTNNAGTLQLDSTSGLAANATVAVFSSASVNLNYAGTQTINALYIDGNLQPSGTWGSPTSGAANTSSIFTGAGVLNVLGAPVIVQQPIPIVCYPDAPNQSFSVLVTGDPSFTYQWKRNGTNISGATDSTYTIPIVQTIDAGTYTVAITNNFGFTNSVGASLTVLPTNNYVNVIRADNPVSYWRLGETNGTLAFDGIGGNVGKYVNAQLNQPGFSLTDSDGSVDVPAANGRGYVQVTNFGPFVFTGAPAFSLEAWAYFTNLTGVQRIFSTLNLVNPNGYSFGINGANTLRFTAGAVADRDQPLNTSLVQGLWYHLVCTCDGSTYHYYVNGQEQGTGQPVASVNGVGVSLFIGCNPLGYTNNTAGDPLAEQIKGRIDEAAIYNYTLTSLQVTNHYSARYGTLAPPVVSTPVANPPTNYVSLSSSIQSVAAGQALSYQWYKSPSTLLPGQTGDTLTLSPLQLSDAGGYYVQVSNPAGTSNSPNVSLAVLSIPTNAAELNLTNNLVLHLAFDNDYQDISGHNNNGTNVGATTLVSPGAVGTNALHYFTDTGSSSFNYVTLGVRPDLQFGSTVNFTVSYWIHQPNGSTFTNLPFFTDAIGSTGHGGFAFAPYQTATTSGGWQLTLGSMSSPSQFTSFPDADLINDGNWHHLVHSADRTANVTTYLDGKQVDSQSIVFIGNINTVNAATIGQDPTGTYPVTASADIDDLAVWLRTVTPLEVSGIFLAGASNSVSFAPPVTSAIVPAALSVQLVLGQVVLTWPGAGGALQAAGNVTGTYTNVPGASSPYTNTLAAPQLFYRLKY
jgi:autotransporter-associated beta strand protein